MKAAITEYVKRVEDERAIPVDSPFSYSKLPGDLWLAVMNHCDR